MTVDEVGAADVLVPRRGGRPVPLSLRGRVVCGVLLLLGVLLPVLFVGVDLAVAGDLPDGVLGRLVRVEVVAGVLLLLVTALALHPVAGRALRPLDELSTAVRGITIGGPGRRLHAPGPETDLGRAGAAFDAVLDELEQSAAQASAAAVALREFFGAASEQLRTPLAELQARAQSLLAADERQREQLVGAMVQQTRQAGRLVEDLMVVSRLDDDGSLADLDLSREPVDLVRLAAEEVERARALTPDRTYEVTVDGLAHDGESELVVPADPLRIGQVLSNVLDNARYATDAGGRIRVDVRRQGLVALVTLWDSGPGVPPEDRERIFVRGAVAPGGSPRTVAAGVGLPIARGLARAHGGDMTCLDRRGEPGGCFQLTLPAPVRR